MRAREILEVLSADRNLTARPALHLVVDVLDVVWAAFGAASPRFAIHGICKGKYANND
jgi:hypothetical protein